MSSSTFGRRPFLVGSGLSLGALLTLPSLAAGAVFRLGTVRLEQLPVVLAGRVVDRSTLSKQVAASETFSRLTGAQLVAMRLDL